jgi:hypothetical protein
VAPAGATIAVTADAETVTVIVSAPVSMLGSRLPAIVVSSAALAAREPTP